MANRYQERKTKTIIIKTFCIILLAVVCGVSMLFADNIEKAFKIGKYTQNNTSQDVSVVTASDLKVHYIDVGQGDSTLIELPDSTVMLIDAGTPDSQRIEDLISYLKTDVKIDKINYLVLTHSDDDHSGGMAKVLQEFEVQHIYRPFQLACKKAQNSEGKTVVGQPIESEDLKQYYVNGTESEWLASQVTNFAYLNFVESAYKETYNNDGNIEKATVTVSYQGLEINSTDSTKPFCIGFYAPRATGEFLLGATNTDGKPVKKYKGKNNASPIMLLEYKEKSFVFTGDAEKEVENDFVEDYKNNNEVKEKFKDVDVYKAGHHGSSTSSTKNFLAFINPTYTVASCGKNNKYGHPSPEFLERWENQVASQGTNRKQKEPLVTAVNKTVIFGVDNAGSLVYCAGVSGSGFVIYWWSIALSIFVMGSIIIISIRVYKNSATKTAKSAVKSVKTARKVIDKYK